MGIFDELNIPLPSIGRVRPAGMRAEAEDYASSLGLTRGGPGWGDAIRRYVLDVWRPTASNPSVRERPSEFPHSEAVGQRRSEFTQEAYSPPSNTLRSADAIGHAMPNDGVDESRQGDRFDSARIDASTSNQTYSAFRRAPGGSNSANARKTDPVQPPPDPSPVGRRAAESFLPPPEDKLRIAIGTDRWKTPARRKARDLPSGTLAEFRETGGIEGGGQGIVSTGRNDPGGRSFGSFQLSTDSGHVKGFVNSDQSWRWRSDLQGLDPESSLFRQRWKAIALREPEVFRRAQQDYFARKIYYPVVDSAWKNTGLDVDRRSEAVREAVWSTSAQHGAAAKIIKDAVRSADFMSSMATGRINRSPQVYDELLIREIYRHRLEYVRGLRSSKPGVQRTYQNIIPQLQDELERALDMLHDEQRP